MVEELTPDQLVRGLVRIGEKEMITHLEKLKPVRTIRRQVA